MRAHESPPARLRAARERGGAQENGQQVGVARRARLSGGGRGGAPQWGRRGQGGAAPGPRRGLRMVFESLVVDVLNRFLGDYVVNLDSSQLKLGIWGGTSRRAREEAGRRAPLGPC